MLYFRFVHNQTQMMEKLKKKYFFSKNNHVEDTSESLMANITCRMCFGFVREPIRHKVCNTLFCKQCLDFWVKHHKSCPCCRNRFQFGQLQTIDSFTQALTNELVLKCPKCSQSEPESHLSDPKRAQSGEPPGTGLSVKKMIILGILSEREKKNEIFISCKENKKSLIKNLKLQSIRHSDNCGLLWGNSRGRRRKPEPETPEETTSQGRGGTFNLEQFLEHLERAHGLSPCQPEFDFENSTIRFFSDIRQVPGTHNRTENIGPDKPQLEFGAEHRIRPKNVVISSVGVFQNRVPEGFGFVFENDRIVYEGHFTGGLFDGVGILRSYFEVPRAALGSETSHENSKGFFQYRGNFLNGKRTGFGVLEFFGNHSFHQEYFRQLISQTPKIRIDLVFKQSRLSCGLFFQHFFQIEKKKLVITLVNSDSEDDSCAGPNTTNGRTRPSSADSNCR